MAPEELPRRRGEPGNQRRLVVVRRPGHSWPQVVAGILVKREDLTGLGFGGNKVHGRKAIRKAGGLPGDRKRIEPESESDFGLLTSEIRVRDPISETGNLTLTPAPTRSVR